jgi:hypothetical protein
MRSTILITAVSGVFALGTAYAQITKEDFKSRTDVIETTYKAAKERCAPMAGNAKDVCQAEAKGEHDVAKKELDAALNPTDKNRYDARVARAEATYKVAKEKCDDQAGNAKDVCVKEAKAAEAKAKADAKLNKQVTSALSTAGEKTADATAAAGEKISEARTDAVDTRREADYKVAKEKCDALSGQAKDNCVTAAKMKYGKS